MSGHQHDRPFPRGALAAATGMVVITLVLTAAPGLGIMDRPQTAQSERIAEHVAPKQQRDLRFLDRADGGLRIVDVTGEEMNLAGEHGFIRGVLRGLARDRQMRGLGAETPFRLTLWKNGRLSLTDLATDRTIELDSFGNTNRDAFMALLEGTPAA
jgi:putative photosynthetic complex assembly protein